MATLNCELIACCDYAIISKEGKLSLIGIFNQIFVHQVPTRFLRLFVVAVFTGDGGSEEQISLEIKDSKGKIIDSRSLKLKLGTNGKANFIATIQGLPIPIVGTYAVAFIQSKKTIVKRELQVVKVKAQNQTQTSNLPN